MLTTLLAAAVVLGVVILVHELGHFWVAKAVDVDVPRFSIGIGPKMVGFRWGETEYVLSWLPLGGYVRMAGMGEEEAFEGIEGEAPDEDREPSDRDFDAKPVWARGAILSAGVGMNLLFAAVLFGIIGSVWGVAPEQDPVVGGVQEERLPEGALPLARLDRGTRITAVGRNRLGSWEDLTLALGSAPDGPTTLHLAGGDSVVFRLPDDQEARSRLMGALVPHRAVDPVLGEVAAGSPADSAGLQSGDRVVAVDDEPVDSWQAFAERVERRPGEAVSVTVRKDGSERTVTLRPAVRTLVSDGDTLRYGRLGVAQGASALEEALGAGGRRLGPVEAVAHGLGQTWIWTVRTVEVLVQLVTGQAAADNLAGPVRIAEMSGDVARMGLLPFLSFMAILSVNLAILNLLPIPVLDGGQLVFLLVEAVRGRAVSVETRIRWTQVGVILVAALMIWAIGNDLLHIFG